MARPDKAAAVAELTEKFERSTGAVLTEYRGLSVKALRELRRALGDDATYAVSKNTLTSIAARQAEVPGVTEHLSGPTAIAFIEGDPVVVAKGLRDFARNNPQLLVKGGVLDGRSMTAEEFRQLADLESREILLAKVAGGLQGVLQQAVSLVAAPLSQAARLLAALETAAQDDPGLIAGSEVAASPAPATPAETEPEPEDPAAAAADDAATAAPVDASASADSTTASAADNN